MLFKKTQRTYDKEVKMASTLSKIKEIGYTDYFSEQWPDELEFSSYREISEFLLNIAISGDQKLFRDSIEAIKSVFRNNPDHEEANYLKYACKELADSTIMRNAAIGISTMSETPDFCESAALLATARQILKDTAQGDPISAMGTEAAILTILEHAPAEEKEEAAERLASMNSQTRYEATRRLDPKKPADLKILGTMLKDPVLYVSQSASQRVYRALNRIKPENLDLIAGDSLYALKQNLLSEPKYRNDTHIEELAAIASASSMLASPRSLEGYSEEAASMLESDDPLAYGAGHAIADKLLARSLVTGASMPSSYEDRMKDFGFFVRTHSISSKSLGISFTSSDTYYAYMKNLDNMLSEGKLSKRDYEKRLSLKADLEKREATARHNAEMLFGILRAGTQSRPATRKNEVSYVDIPEMMPEENFLLKSAIDGIMVSEIKWQRWLSLRLDKAAAKRNPYRAYWNMLRFESKAHRKASKEVYERSATSGIFEDYVPKLMKKLNMYLMANIVDSRLFMMHETDLEARFSEMEKRARMTSGNNAKFIELVSEYCKERGIMPEERYTKDYESLLASNFHALEEEKSLLRA